MTPDAKKNATATPVTLGVAVRIDAWRCQSCQTIRFAERVMDAPTSPWSACPYCMKAATYAHVGILFAVPPHLAV